MTRLKLAMTHLNDISNSLCWLTRDLGCCRGRFRRRSCLLAALGMLDKRVDQSRLDFQRQAPHDCLVDSQLTTQLDQLAAIEPEIREPIGPLLVTADRIGQLLFLPQAADEHFAAEPADELRNCFSEAS